jgi:hypothetical protein
MRQFAFAGLMMLLGFAGGAVTVSSNHFLGAVMGAILGGAVAVIVLAFPRSHDYPDNDYWFRD